MSRDVMADRKDFEGDDAHDAHDICECGHELGQHVVYNTHDGARDCIECDCGGFQPIGPDIEDSGRGV